MIYFCTNGFHPEGRDAALYVRATDAIAAVEYAISVFNNQGDYVLPIRAVDCNGNGASTGWNDNDANKNTIKTF